MLKAALVSYLNTKPFIQGIEHYFSSEELELSLLPPAQCAAALKARNCDLALVPVGALADLQGVKVMKDFCIGAKGKVESVFLLSTVPLHQITTVILDNDSRTSNLLAKVLASRYWKRNFEWTHPNGNLDSLPKGTACVRIGDKAMQQKSDFPVVIDLAAEWQHFTGLPFVFAVWAYYPENVSRITLEKFRQALNKGTAQLEEVAIRFAPQFGLTTQQALHYYSNCICYQFDSFMHEGFDRFVKELKLLEG